MKTTTGFEYTLEEGAGDNMELLDLLGELSDGDVRHAKQAVIFLIGDDGQKRLYEHCRKGKTVSIESVMTELGSIINNGFTDDVKNS